MTTMPLTSAETQAALGRTIHDGADETARGVLKLCQSRRARNNEPPTTMREQERILTASTAASRLVGRWLSTGELMSRAESAQLADIGTSVAAGDFGLVEVTMNYLAWRDIATRHMRREAAQLYAEPDQLEERIEEAVEEVEGTIRNAADLGLVLMTRQFSRRHDLLKNELAEEHTKLSHLAMHDPLTGLVNRTQLLDRLEHALAASRRTETHVAVFFLDLDSFKVVNDELGHDTGDRLLQALAGRLLGGTQAGDTVARFGGDEFVILCPDLASAERAEAIRGRLHGLLSVPFAVPDELRTGVSIGFAVATAQDDAARLIARADADMYVDKASRVRTDPNVISMK